MKKWLFSISGMDKQGSYKQGSTLYSKPIQPGPATSL